jgi:hypothetical protein
MSSASARTAPDSFAGAPASGEGSRPAWADAAAHARTIITVAIMEKRLVMLRSFHSRVWFNTPRLAARRLIRFVHVTVAYILKENHRSPPENRGSRSCFSSTKKLFYE